MAKIVVFGVGQNAEVAFFHLQRDTSHDTVGFTVDYSFVPDDGRKLGLPVIPFGNLEEIFPPSECYLFIPIGYTGWNEARKERYDNAKSRGYKLISYVSNRAIMDGFCGDNCMILELNNVQPFVTIGNDCILWSGNHIGHHTKIGNHVFIASHAVISGSVTIGDLAFVGVNATISDGVTIGEGAVVGAGACIYKDIEPYTVYAGPGMRKLRTRAKQERA
jgi:sugar O-acyltransferase (sialic acid O-acetyltransferase NeuD family)